MIIFVRSSALDRDIRLPKEIVALNQAGYRTKLLYWDRDCCINETKKLKGCEDIPLRLKAPWGIKILPFLPIWWSFVFICLLITSYDVIHAVNFDCIIPSLIAGRLKRKYVVYEILDIYEEQIPLPRAIKSILLKVDKLFMRLADAVIIADEAQIEGIGGIPNPKVVPIYDSPPNISIGEYIREESTCQPNKPFTLFYAGALYKARRLNLEKVLEAIRDLNGVKLVIAGYGDLVDEIRKWMSQMPDKVEFIGKISYQEVIQRGNSDADLFFILRDSAIPINRFTCGSNLFNAMICGKPILANKGSSTAAKVHENNCGLVVDANNVEEIKKAIIKLRDNPELCKELGANGRRAYEHKYSWEIMEHRLVSLYQKLTMKLERDKKGRIISRMDK